MTAEENRREFEEWAESKNFSLPKGNRYISPATDIAWESWQAARERKWKPIETAPRDGTRFLAIEKDNSISVVMAGESYDGDFIWYNMEMIHVIATHWMPLPTPPTNEPNKWDNQNDE